MTTNFKIATSTKREIVDITDRIQNLLSQLKVKEGLAYAFARHTTCALIVTELEGSLEQDILKFIQEESPKGPFKHSHGAGTSHTPAHILSTMIGQSVVVPVVSGQLDLGTWQRICLLELDGPRTRQISAVFI